MNSQLWTKEFQGQQSMSAVWAAMGGFWSSGGEQLTSVQAVPGHKKPAMKKNAKILGDI